VRIWLDDVGQLRFSAPKGTLTAGELQDLRGRRAEVTELLARAELLRGFRPRGQPEQALPLTALQLRKWRYAHETRSGRSERTCVIAQRIRGRLERDVLQRSFRSVIERNDALRIRFVESAEGVRQYADASLLYEIEFIEAGGTGDDVHEVIVARCERLLAELVPLRTGPLVAAMLFRLSADEHVFMVAMDHIISDGASCQLVAEAIWTTYRRDREGSPIISPEPLPLQFLDYVAWQHRTCDTWLTVHGSYWKERLAGLPPRARPSPSREPQVSRTTQLVFDQQLTARVRDLAHRERTLPALVVLSLYVAAIARWLCRLDLLLAFVSNGRDRPELQQMVGFLADYLHLRIRVSNDESFQDLLHQVAAEFRCAYEHQDFGRVPDLVPDCKPELCFNWLPAVSARRFAENTPHALTVEPLPLRLSFPLSDPITVAPLFIDQPTTIAAIIYYQPEVFAAHEIERLVKILLSLAEQAVQRPGALLSGALCL
jgi:hypothetical protein